MGARALDRRNFLKTAAGAAGAVAGGIALVSSSREANGGARHWFAGLGTAGAKVARRPERAEGPVLGTLYTLNGPVLKLTAQLLPVGDQYYEHRPTTREQGPEPTLDVLYRLTILGDRQERFLAGWAAADPGSPKICFSQTLWGCLQPTSGAGPSSTPTPTPPWPPAAPPWSWSSGVTKGLGDVGGEGRGCGPPPRG